MTRHVTDQPGCCSRDPQRLTAEERAVLSAIARGGSRGGQVAGRDTIEAAYGGAGATFYGPWNSGNLQDYGDSMVGVWGINGQSGEYALLIPCGGWLRIRRLDRRRLGRRDLTGRLVCHVASCEQQRHHHRDHPPSCVHRRLPFEAAPP